MAEDIGSIEPLLPLLSLRPLALFSDIDGTLAPIVSRPEDAHVSSVNRRLLRDLVSIGVRVALITGRPAETARRMTRVDGLVYAANHGMTLWIDGREEISDNVRPYVQKAEDAARELALLSVPGVMVELTGPNIAIHYRRAANEESARCSILEAISASPAANTLRLTEGRKVFELRPPVDIDKGTALRDLANRFGAAAIICIGDDTTDLDMFRAVADLRRSGTPGACIAVASDEAPMDLLAAADYQVSGVPGVEWVLGELLKVLRERWS